MTSRRQFFAAGAGLLTAMQSRAAKAPSGTYPYTELEARIAKRDFRDITKDVLPTPCMVVDLGMFEQNIKHMADYAKSAGINVRPHVKIHKSVDVGKRQIAAGAIGLTCATIAEAELMSGAGIQHVMWTKQPASRNNIARAVALSRRDPTFIFVVDDPQVVDWVDQAAALAGANLRIVVSVYAGLDRQGIENGQPAIDLAQKVMANKRMKFEGFMAYTGNAAHTHGFAERKAKSASDLSGLQDTLALAKKAGMPVNIVTGGSTGTYNIDKENNLTELEAGSYVFMDTAYFAIGNKQGDPVYTDFAGALTVLTTVDSLRHARLATIDYGNKAMLRPTDKVKGSPKMQIVAQGAEYGGIKWESGDRELKLGERVELYCSNLDTSTNCYDRYFVARGEQIVDVWPIMGRSGSAQR
jgi:D-serine deaminase-like pyridoxal phosphate-dependent protein